MEVVPFLCYHEMLCKPQLLRLTQSMTLYMFLTALFNCENFDSPSWCLSGTTQYTDSERMLLLCLLQATFLNLRNQTYKYNEKKVNLSSLALLMSFLLEAMSFSIIPTPTPRQASQLETSLLKVHCYNSL